MSQLKLDLKTNRKMNEKLVSFNVFVMLHVCIS